jgi:hypothetical protein
VARQGKLSGRSRQPEWVTVREAARRLGMSGAWFKSFAKNEDIHARRGNQPCVDWTTVETYIARSRITRVDESLRPKPDLRRPVWGVALLDRVQSRFGWSDPQFGRALGVTPAVVLRYRRNGLPDHQVSRLRRLSRLPLEAAAVSVSGGAVFGTRASCLSVKWPGGWSARVAPYASIRIHPRLGLLRRLGLQMNRSGGNRSAAGGRSTQEIVVDVDAAAR